ncbi:SOUL family heme-binding protein [Oryzibacter oryziterrae]|uniref:SOUL family heme-binding protein n=1 Tax=Oryzibacter oryziterrae TaxID=2766474 RepID=UPI001F41B5E7|nr:heme-binding protein [Oryzibacter oryziterrae]
MTIEEPKFSLVLKEGAFELRDYAPCIVAEVAVTGDQQAAGGKGFRPLANYIFGANAKSPHVAMATPVGNGAGGEKIAMTAPVTLIGAPTGHWLVRFTMPSAYALADLPIPNDPQVQLRSMPAARYAVLRFSGLTSVAKVSEQASKLTALVRARGLVPSGRVSLARYNPPWTLWFMRRNEVMFPVKLG